MQMQRVVAASSKSEQLLLFVSMRQTTVTAYLKRNHLLLFVFTSYRSHVHHHLSIFFYYSMYMYINRSSIYLCVNNHVNSNIITINMFIDT